uniref:Cadherin domain-containing protein n=1 Tax=Sinocyclocheilus grahami TaxID=75366 RepID=A0A672T6X3_SINGR
VGHFVVDTYKGLLIGTAWYANETIAEDNIKINIVVEDQNDNPPVFIKPERSSVYEGSPVGTFVTQVVAKDADEPNILHTKIAYSLIDYTDICMSFVLPVQAADMYGTSTDENEAPVEVLRIQALDNDDERTDNWLTEFEIVSGSEDGRFSIETDAKINMGVLYLNKVRAYFVHTSDINLNLVVANKALPGAPLGSGAGAAGAGGASGAGVQHMFFGGSSSVPKEKTYLVKISVKNKPGGSTFKPKIKPISVSENTKKYFPRVIDTYTAIEKDTGKTAEKVKYAKGYDPDNWISIDTDTAEIKLNKVPDRESPFVVNGTYYAKILCITDELHSQTSTGTIALQVEDLNDNCPKLLNNVQTVCSDTRVVNVTAEDEDSDPNGAPLEFRLIQEKTKGKWNLASLLAEDDLWPGFYEVTMEIRDKQGLVCPDEKVLRLEVCTCSEGTFCVSKMAAILTTLANFGAAGNSFLILGFLCLILALMSVIKCEFGNHGKLFIDIPFETKQHLISYCTDVIDYPKQGLKHYDYEGEGSVTSSIGSCSFIESNDDLEFLNNLGSKFNTYTVKLISYLHSYVFTFLFLMRELARKFSQPALAVTKQSVSAMTHLNCIHTDPKVIVNTVETTPNAAASSSHVTNIIQPRPEEIPVKSPLVQPEPNQGIVIQEPMYYGFNQPMASNVLLSEKWLGQGVYIINGTPESGRILTQGNGHTLEHFSSGQQAVLANNIIGDSVLYSQIGPQSPAMITKGLGEVNPAVIENLSPTPNLVLMPQQQLDHCM